MRRIVLPGQARQNIHEIPSQPIVGCTPLIQATTGSINRRIIQVDPEKKQDPISKITKAKRARGVAQVVEHLPSKVGLVPTPVLPRKQSNKK
jgi:hypothetical protein